MKLEEVTRRAQEQLQIVLEEQSRLEKFNLDFIYPSLLLSPRSELDHLVVTKARWLLHGKKALVLVVCWKLDLVILSFLTISKIFTSFPLCFAFGFSDLLSTLILMLQK